SHLVPMEKEGVTLDIHPSCVAQHQRLGWVVVARANLDSPQHVNKGDKAVDEVDLPEQLFAADSDGDAKLTVPEIRAALTERGLVFNPKAKRPELLALLSE